MNTTIKILYLHIACDLKSVEGVLTDSGLSCDIIVVSDEQSFISVLNRAIPDIVLADDAISGFPITDVLTILQQQDTKFL